MVDRSKIEAARREGYRQAQKEHDYQARIKQIQRDGRNQILFMMATWLAGILTGISMAG